MDTCTCMQVETTLVCYSPRMPTCYMLHPVACISSIKHLNRGNAWSRMWVIMWRMSGPTFNKAAMSEQASHSPLYPFRKLKNMVESNSDQWVWLWVGPVRRAFRDCSLESERSWLCRPSDSSAFHAETPSRYQIQKYITPTYHTVMSLALNFQKLFATKWCLHASVCVIVQYYVTEALKATQPGHISIRAIILSSVLGDTE